MRWRLPTSCWRGWLNSRDRDSADVQVSITRNYGETGNDKAMKLIKKLLFATAAVVALVWFAMGRREAMVVGIAVLLTTGRDAVCIVGVGFYAEPRVACSR